MRLRPNHAMHPNRSRWRLRRRLRAKQSPRRANCRTARDGSGSCKVARARRTMHTQGAYAYGDAHGIARCRVARRCGGASQGGTHARCKACYGIDGYDHNDRKPGQTRAKALGAARRIWSEACRAEPRMSLLGDDAEDCPY